MKTLRITLFTAVVALAATLFTGCGGADGPAGATGPTGPYGQPGDYFTFTSNTADWSPSVGSDGFNYEIAGYQNGNIGTDLTASSIATGVVAVYFQTSSPNGPWVPLPATYPIGVGVEQTLTFNYNVNSLVLQIQNSDNSAPASPNPFNVNVVVIPTAVIKQHPGLNTKDYYEVMQVLKSVKAGNL